MAQHPIAAGFADPVHNAQHAFRSALEALSRPGRCVTLGARIDGLSLGPAMSHLLLALTDDDTSVWWQKDENGESDWLRFHTGARRTLQAKSASFAVLTHAADPPVLTTFAQGTAESPEKSCTMLIEVPSLESGPGIEWRGPGIQASRTVRIDGLATDFWTQWQQNHAAFPCGVDIIFTCAALAMGLPRTTRLRRLEGV